MFWPFNIPAKRREREAQQQREEVARRQRIKDSIEAENRRQRERAAPLSTTSSYRTSATAQRQAMPSTLSSHGSSSVYNDPLSPANPLSPLNPINQASSWSSPAEEPRHTPAPCGSSYSHSSNDYSSSHSHSSHDHSCSSSSYDSSTSSSYDSSSSSSSSFD